MKGQKTPVVYVTRDRERADGMPEDDGYYIYSGDGTEDTLKLLEKAEFPRGTTIVVFKNTKQIEELSKKHRWKLLNPYAALAEEIENKITQVSFLGELSNLLPPHHITLVKKIIRDTSREDETSIVQWAHSHTGEGTIHIQKESDLKIIQDKFPEREARVTLFIKGPVFTVNIVVTKDGLHIGNPSYQITGVAPYTDNPFSTVGNDWSAPQTILTESKLLELQTLAKKVGERMKSRGWRGLFGIDVVYDEERDKLFLIEINARQPASTTYESQLQSKLREAGIPGITIFEAHLRALLDLPITEPLIEINDGAQIVQRVTASRKHVETDKLESAGYKIITYKNTKPNSDLVRIQSSRGIIEAHNKFNKRGKEIEELLSGEKG